MWWSTRRPSSGASRTDQCPVTKRGLPTRLLSFGAGSRAGGARTWTRLLLGGDRKGLRLQPRLPQRGRWHGLETRSRRASSDHLPRRGEVVQLRGLLGRRHPDLHRSREAGHQQLAGQNRDLAENTRANFVFEGGVGSRALRCVGTAEATRYWRSRGFDDQGVERKSSAINSSFAMVAEVAPGVANWRKPRVRFPLATRTAGAQVSIPRASRRPTVSRPPE